MKLHNSEMVDALVDGQLTGWRGWFARRHLSKCPICALEYRRQAHVRQMLAANPPALTVPGSPEEFWDRIRNTIEDQSVSASATTPDPLHLSLQDWLWDRPALVPALALAVVVIACGAFWLQFGRPPMATPEPVLVAKQQPAAVAPAPAAIVPPEPTAVAPEPTPELTPAPEEHAALTAPEQPATTPDAETTLAAVERVETTVPHAVATTVHVEEGGVTVIWVSGLPWTDNMTDMETLFAHPYDYFGI